MPAPQYKGIGTLAHVSGALRRVPYPAAYSCQGHNKNIPSNIPPPTHLKPLAVGEHAVAGPRGGDGGGVLPRKQDGNQQARDLAVVGGAPAVNVLVPAVNQHLRQHGGGGWMGRVGSGWQAYGAGRVHPRARCKLATCQQGTTQCGTPPTRAVRASLAPQPLCKSSQGTAWAAAAHLQDVVLLDPVGAARGDDL